MHEQICLSNLENDLFIIENSPNYQKLLERSDFFLVTSLLDPLPNVAIDALSEAKPTFCFDRGCGLAEYYRNTDLYDELVVSFFDIESMSKKIIDLIKNPEKRKNISKASSKFAKDIFCESPFGLVCFKRSKILSYNFSSKVFLEVNF